MTKPDEYYPVNLFPALQWALDLYFKKHPKYRDPPIVEVIFPAGSHKVLMKTIGEHEIVFWMSKRKLYVKARCLADKECKFNVSRVNADDREALKTINWEKIDSRQFFQIMRKWVVRLDLDFITLIRALNTICDTRVKIPLTTQYDRTFGKFDDYRRNRWPADATPNNPPKFIEEVLVRVTFWFMTAATVGALV